MLAATYFVAMPPQRYGTYGDGFACGDADSTGYHATLADYFFLTDPLPDELSAKQRVVDAVGVCPYQFYFAKTWALELWVLAGVGAGVSAVMANRDKHGRVR